MSRAIERTDILLLATAILLSIVLVAGTIGLGELLYGTIDIALHDTYFVAQKSKIFLLINSIVIYVTFLVRQWLCGFNRNFGNYILTISASILLLLTSFLEKLIWTFQLLMNVEWHTTLSKDGSLFKGGLIAEIVFLIIKIVIITTLLLTGYKLGMNKTVSKTYE